jgi:hypothetical protein
MWEHSADRKEAEGCCIERATASDYIHNQMSKQVTNRVTWIAVHRVPYELRCQADMRMCIRRLRWASIWRIGCRGRYIRSMKGSRILRFGVTRVWRIC